MSRFLTTPKKLLKLKVCRLINNFTREVFAEEWRVLLCQGSPEHAMLFRASTEDNVRFVGPATNAFVTRAFSWTRIIHDRNATRRSLSPFSTEHQIGTGQGHVPQHNLFCTKRSRVDATTS